MLLRGDKKRIRLLKLELEHLISEYLVEPSDVGYLALSIAYWVNELTELAYDIDDCVDMLVYKLGHGSKITRVCNKMFYRTFIIVDDLWPLSTWHIISAAFPDGDHGSRILVTTEVDSVAQECCGHNSKHIFNMELLTDKASSELFLSRGFGHLCDLTVNQSEALREIIRECRGLPLATITTASVLGSQPRRLEQWKGDYMANSSSINWATNPELEGMKLVLCLSYNALPHRLKACMLYLCIYKEEYIILKDDLVKQWVAEGFVSAIGGEDREEVAGYKSMGDNFVTVLDHSQTDIALAQKISAYHLNMKLPISMKHLNDLVTFEMEGRLDAVPHDIVKLPGLLHLSLPSETDLPDRIGRMTSLRALRHFNLSRNSVENVESLGDYPICGIFILPVLGWCLTG
ncbi:Disease resistance protein RPM1 [Dichanthelium oligosanthes]|uniref:Disease resistance protein RPM1 n=1 Tax=Dichanthelium oligosanthes TaxID=888268 RepID=A0A1E5V6P4_9POAL|nr:Disease resistance protein RPM1 [Dichanthelium oligosanthes]